MAQSVLAKFPFLFGKFLRYGIIEVLKILVNKKI